MEASSELNSFLDPNFALRLFSKFGQINEIVPKIKLIIAEFQNRSKINGSNAMTLKNNQKSIELREEADRCRDNKDALHRVLALYNESICYAEDAENRAVLYARRSSVYSDLKEYTICLENIRLSKDNGCSGNLMVELNERENDCLERMQRQSNDPKKKEKKFNVKVNVEPHPQMPFAASCLELQTDSVRGRYIVTTEDVDPGTILIIESPFEKVLSNDFIYQRCSNCLQRHLLNLIPCLNCTKAMFCSEACQQDASNNFHQYECPIIDCLYDVGGQITLRAFLKAIQSFNSIQELIRVCTPDMHNLTAFSFDHSKTLSAQQLYQQIHCLSTNQNIRSQLDLFTHAMVAALFYYQLCNYTSFKSRVHEENSDCLIELMFRIELITTINSFNFNDLSSIQDNNIIIGTGLYPLSSLINHSCCPNSCLKYCNTKLILYTTQSIKKGESLSISYNGSHAYLPKQKRQSFLTGKYQFLCQCIACVNDFPLLSNMVLANIPEIHSNNINIQLNRMVAEDIFRKCCVYLREYYHYYPCKEVYSAQIWLSKILSYLIVNDDNFQIELTIGKLGNVNPNDIILLSAANQPTESDL